MRRDRRPARDMLLELVDVVGDAPPGLFAAKLVRQIDLDGLGHSPTVGGRSALFKPGQSFSASQPPHRHYAATMSWLLAFSIAASAAASQLTMFPAPSPSPAAAYITAGQDEPGYRNWYAASPAHRIAVTSFNTYLTTYGVGGIVPTWQLLRTATAWQHCGAQPFEVPPVTEWPHIVQTLRYINDYVVPRSGRSSRFRPIAIRC